MIAIIYFTCVLHLFVLSFLILSARRGELRVATLITIALWAIVWLVPEAAVTFPPLALLMLGCVLMLWMFPLLLAIIICNDRATRFDLLLQITILSIAISTAKLWPVLEGLPYTSIFPKAYALLGALALYRIWWNARTTESVQIKALTT